MPVEAVLAVLDALEQAGVRAWLGGGWGVDALLGEQTRPHRDLDLLVEAAQESAALAALAQLGYEVETDWRPIRVEVVAPGSGWVDLHPVEFDVLGDGVQAGPDRTSFFYPNGCLVTGSLAGRTVGCLSAEQQLLFHQGYEPRDRDCHDLALLRALVGDR